MVALITVFGGSGFLGGEIVERLAAKGSTVRIAVRRPERAILPKPSDSSGRVTAMAADVRDGDSVKQALCGASAAVNAVSLYAEQVDDTFVAVHVEGAQLVARQAAEGGVERLAHLSGIGADAGSSSSYVRARAGGEMAVLDAYPGATILRPSVVFGPGDATFAALAAIIRRSPFLPLFGKGGTRLQPVYIGDVADAAVAALDRPATAGRVVELGGPDILTYEALLRLLMRQLGRRRLLFPLPFTVWRLLATLLSPLPHPPVTHDQITLMERDNVVGSDALTFADLGIVPTAMQDILPTYLPR